MANSRIRYTVKNVFQILEDDFHTEKMALLLLHILLIVILDVNMAKHD